MRLGSSFSWESWGACTCKEMHVGGITKNHVKSVLPLHTKIDGHIRKKIPKQTVCYADWKGHTKYLGRILKEVLHIPAKWNKIWFGPRVMRSFYIWVLPFDWFRWVLSIHVRRLVGVLFWVTWALSNLSRTGYLVNSCTKNWRINRINCCGFLLIDVMLIKGGNFSEFIPLGSI